MSGVVCRHFYEDHKQMVDELIHYFEYETMADFLKDVLELGFGELVSRMAMMKEHDFEEEIKAMPMDEFRERILCGFVPGEEPDYKRLIFGEKKEDLEFKWKKYALRAKKEAETERINRSSSKGDEYTWGFTGVQDDEQN